MVLKLSIFYGHNVENGNESVGGKEINYDYHLDYYTSYSRGQGSCRG